MEQLDNALDQIAQIHRLMIRTHTFRGYRAVTTLFTACIALAAAAFQPWWVPDPVRDPLRFVDLWIAVALTCIVVVAAEIIDRYRRTDSPLQRQMTIQAVEQFLPVILVGGLVTAILCQSAKQSLWLLPGLWSIFFGLGILASRHLLPRPLGFVGFFYILAGLTCIAVFQGPSAFSPWLVAVPFGIGQTAAAAILHWNLERIHVIE
jgi:hypothetical protein